MTIELSKTIYTATATAEGGREGHTATDDGKLDVKLAPPAEMGGSGNGTNPEQLFAAGYASCFHSAMKITAARMKLDAEGSTVTAAIGIGPITDGVGYGITAALTISLPGVADSEQANALVEAAHEVCPYSNATRGNMAVALTVT